jgi:hypothetical protein
MARGISVNDAAADHLRRAEFFLMARTLFHAPAYLAGDPVFLQRLLLTGLDRTPRLASAQWEGPYLAVQLDAQNSVKLSVPWRTRDRRELLLDTVSLRHRDRPYNLSLELARGLLNRIRMPPQSLSECGRLEDGSSELNHSLHQITRRFVEAVLSQSDANASTSLSAGVIEDGLQWQDTWQAGRLRDAEDSWRRKIGMRIPAFITRRDFESTGLDSSLAAVDCGTAVNDWGDLPSRTSHPWNWCPARGMTTFAGPIIARDDEFHDLQQIVDLYQRTVCTFPGHVDIWHCWSGLNKFTRPGHCEQSRLRLAVSSVELLYRVDPQRARMVSFDQPFGEYLARESHHDFGPLQFAETLVRGDLPLTYLGLELNFGAHTDATPWRDVLSLHARLDRWACLGLPLVILLTCPSRSTPAIESTTGETLAGDAAENAPLHDDQCDADDIELLLHALASRRDVQAVVWNAWHDKPQARPPRFGFFDPLGIPRASLAAFRRVTERR